MREITPNMNLQAEAELEALELIAASLAEINTQEDWNRHYKDHQPYRHYADQKHEYNELKADQQSPLTVCLNTKCTYYKDKTGDYDQDSYCLMLMQHGPGNPTFKKDEHTKVVSQHSYTGTPRFTPVDFQPLFEEFINKAGVDKLVTINKIDSSRKSFAKEHGSEETPVLLTMKLTFARDNETLQKLRDAVREVITERKQAMVGGTPLATVAGETGGPVPNRAGGAEHPFSGPQ